MGIVSTLRGCILGAAIIAIASMASGQPVRQISIALSSTSLGTAGVRAAKEMGFFAKHGVDPKFTVLDSASAAMTALISRSVEVALAGPTELITAQARGQKVVAIATTYRGLGTCVVLAKPVAEKLRVSPTAPVSERLKALDAVVLGAPSATSIATISVKSAAKAVGANVRFTYMSQPAMLAALESGAIQGFSASAPFWALPILKGGGVLWLSGPKGELGADYSPASTGQLQVMRDFAEANPELVKSLAAALADLAKAIDERPADVKAAVAKLHPDLDAKTLDFLFPTESLGWKAKPPTPKDIAHDIAFTKLTGAALPQIDSISPASMIFP